MKRLHHLSYTAQRGGEQIRDDEPAEYTYVATRYDPVYQHIRQALQRWDIKGIAKDAPDTYERETVLLLKHLPTLQHVKAARSLIYDLFALALRKWDILGLAKCDEFAYEDVVIWLIQHLKPLSDYNDVERLLLQAFADQQGLNQLNSDDALRLQALAADIFACWNQYLQRHETATFSHARSRARGLMGRHDTPRTYSR
jgi:hypothetical protein